MEVRYVTRNETDNENVTQEILDVEMTSLRLDSDYIYYYIHWTKLLFTGVIPFIYLMVINVGILKQIRKMINSKQLRPSRGSIIENKNVVSNRYSVTLVAIVV